MRWVDELPKREGNFGGNNRRYPWRQIAESGQPAVLEPETDFDTLKSVRAACWSWAYANGWRVRTRVTRDGEFAVEFRRRQ